MSIMRFQLNKNNKIVLVALTQFRENYGAHDWDGEGSCPDYWKNKGGNEFVVIRDIFQPELNAISRSRSGLLGTCVDTFNRSVPKSVRMNHLFQEFVVGYREYFTSPSGNFVYENDEGEIYTCSDNLDKALKTTKVGKKLEYNLGDNIDWTN